MTFLILSAWLATLQGIAKTVQCQYLSFMSRPSLMSLFEFHNGLLISPSLNKSFFFNLGQSAFCWGNPEWVTMIGPVVQTALAPIIAGHLVYKNPSIVVEDFL